jgi:ribosome maturation factor RimP
MVTENTEQILELAEPIAQEHGYFVVDAEFKTGNGNELWVYLDGEDQQVDVDRCAEISRELGVLLEAHNLITDKLTLNVSSPGLSRPLTDPRQFPKNEGRTIRVRYQTSEGTRKITGKLSGVDSTHIHVTDDEEETIPVSYTDILEAKIIPQFK